MDRQESENGFFSLLTAANISTKVIYKSVATTARDPRVRY